MPDTPPIIEIKEFDFCEKKRIIPWEIEGLLFTRYFNSRLTLTLYAYYYWCGVCNEATRAYGAYVNGRCIGIMMAAFEGEPRRYTTWYTRAFVRFFIWFSKRRYPENENTYELTNEEMYQETFGENPPDGIILLLLADPHTKIRGIGTAFLNELIRTDAGKTIYLFSDGDCSYQFYEHRGFSRMNTRSIVVSTGEKSYPLICYLYTREL